MTKKEKTMDELLSKVNMDRLKSLPGVTEQDVAKVELLHDMLKKGKTWDDKELKDVFRVLPDSYPLCTTFTHNEVLIRIGKAKPIKVVSRHGVTDSRLRWVPIEKAEEFNIPPTIPIKGYEIFCAGCGDVFIGKEPFHQSFCSKCARRGRKQIEVEPKPEVKSKSVKPKVKPSKSSEDKPKAKRKGRPASVKTTAGKPPKQKEPERKPSAKKSTRKATPKKQTKKGGTRKKK